jgi:putative drug exporter of the RND superfamily
MFRWLTRLADRRHWTVIIASVAFAGIAAVFGGPVVGQLSTGGFTDPKADSSIARTRAADAGGADTAGVIALVQIPAGIQSPASQAEISRVAAALGGDRDVAVVVNPLTTHDPAMVSSDGRLTYVVAFWKPVGDTAESAAAKRVQAALATDHGVKLGGYTIAQADVQTQVSHDLAKAEELAFPILFVLLVIVFRGVIAALLPLLVGGLTIIVTFLGLSIVNNFDPLSIFAVNLVTGLGLGLGIDYSLLVLSRFREELGAGRTRSEALRRTMMTAGRTILFSSLTVAAAAGSLSVFPEKFLYSMGIGGAIGTLVAATVSLTVLPAVLAALGHNVDKFSLRRRRPAQAEHRGAWYRIAAFVMRRPVVIAVASAAVLILAGLPFTRIAFTSVDATVLPESYTSRQVDDALRHDFPAFHLAPATVIVNATPQQANDVQLLAQRIGGVAGVAQVTPPRQLSSTVVQINAILANDPLAPASRDAVTSIRGISTPLSTVVGGPTAEFVDLQASLARTLPLAAAIIAVFTLVVLFAATGSLVLPVKALLMNVLSLSATFGILVLIFQDGRFQSILGYTSQGALESTQPILLFALAFGLSTDYGVFLLTRIKESHDHGATNSVAVATGLERTGRIITAAAVCFCVAIGSFATSDIIFIKELGVGTALAVLIDASLVRALLVPALMALLGRWNWWAPGPLRRLYQRAGFARLEAAEPLTTITAA